MLQKLLSLSIMTLVLIAACAKKDYVKPELDQIDAYVKAHPDLPELDKSCIYDGRFEVGLKQETVRFLLGEPKKIEYVNQPWAVQENWVYTKGGRKVFIVEDKHVVGILQD
ncbi:MAG: hypothetical protein GF398_04990 [Chitinivibrionales bacterium]|nr:hypothetical protein [Chitinivibrionales bacterium]